MAVAQTSPRDGGEVSGQSVGRQPELTREQQEQRWLDLWAFATAPSGLGLPPTFWYLTSIEFNAQKRQWARVQAQALNLQANTEGVPFIPEDFLGLSDRAVRIAEAKVQREMDEMQVATESFRLLSFQTKTAKMDDSLVPDWARGDKKHG